LRNLLVSISILLCASLLLQTGCTIPRNAEAAEGIESGITVILDVGSVDLPEGSLLRIGNLEKKLKAVPLTVITGLAPGDYRMEVLVPGFAPHHSLVSTFPNTLNTVVVRLLPVKSSEFEYDGNEIKIWDTTMDIKIDPGTFEGLKEGQTVMIQRSHIDVESDLVHAMPGDFSATNRDGDSVQLETFGAFELTARADGNELKSKRANI